MLTKNVASPWGLVIMGVPQERRRVLVVEDDPVIAIMLQDMLRELDCTVVGPAASVTAALKLIIPDNLDGAVLDCNLGREYVWPVAIRLLELRVPFVFSTGYGSSGTDQRFPGVPVLAKPYHIRSLARALLPLLNQSKST